MPCTCGAEDVQQDGFEFDLGHEGLTVDAIVEDSILLAQEGITVLRDVAHHSDDDLASVAAANSLIEWSQISMESILPIDEDADRS